MPASERPLIGIDIKLKHLRDEKTGEVVGPGQYETGFAFRDNYSILNRYVDAVYEAGGMPLLIPPFTDEDILKDYLNRADGFVFVGINDYPPDMYREPKKIETVVQSTEGYRRQAVSNLALAKLVFHQYAPMPALGICAGPELFNIALGGKLVQHLPSSEAHIAHAPVKDRYHVVTICGGWVLPRLFGKTRIEVNTNHHQAADPDHLGEGLQIAARTDDGVVEAVESVEKRYFLGVQWHPERHRQAEHRQKVLGELIREAVEYRGKSKKRL